LPREQSAFESIAPGAHPWTLRSALARGRDVLQREGVRALWFKALGETVYRRLLLLERELDDAPRVLDASVPLEFGFLSEADIDEYAALRGDRDPAVAAGRLRRGDRCFVARHEGRLVAALWVATGEAEFEYLGRRLRLGENEAQRYDSFTAPELRGRGVIAAVGTRLDRQLREENIRRVRGTALPENAAALRALAKGGYRPIGKIGYVKLGPWRRDFGGLSR
jgi:RimJ/RimL family protein N-acetyltransferase